MENALVESARSLGVKSLEMKLNRLRKALDGVLLSEDEKAALAQGTVPVLTPEVAKFLSIRGEYSDALAEFAAIRQQQYAVIADALGHSYPHYWTADDVREWCSLGATHPLLDAKLTEDLLVLRKVPNAPFRARVLGLLRDGYSKESIVTPVYRALSRYESEFHLDERGKPIKVGVSYFRSERDWSAVEDILGLVPQRTGSSHRIFITYEKANVLAKALRMDPHTAGV